MFLGPNSELDYWGCCYWSMLFSKNYFPVFLHIYLTSVPRMLIPKSNFSTSAIILFFLPVSQRLLRFWKCLILAYSSSILQIKFYFTNICFFFKTAGVFTKFLFIVVFLTSVKQTFSWVRVKSGCVHFHQFVLACSFLFSFLVLDGSNCF